ncbi:MAG: MmcQ/YjbR family DNA-binding protein [Cyclobacteriaceae bacterium]|nr:MmcQ/YjbR family DNA-binding protein [Cyclobacteriaceae bacterium]
MNASALEKLCLGLEGTTTDVKWGNDLCYLVAGKMYCVTGLNAPFTASFKTTPEEFAQLTERAGIIPAPYVARYHWVLVEKAGALKETEWAHFVKQSHQLVVDGLPGKLKRTLGRPVAKSKVRRAK